ncbi:MAG: hypothetical protein QOF88_5774, partial [Mycobacterium sp.]|nr:hypothetical protein [Mycobacterium sp.]
MTDSQPYDALVIGRSGVDVYPLQTGVGTQVVQNPVHRRVELTSLFDDLV